MVPVYIKLNAKKNLEKDHFMLKPLFKETNWLQKEISKLKKEVKELQKK